MLNRKNNGFFFYFHQFAIIYFLIPSVQTYFVPFPLPKKAAIIISQCTCISYQVFDNLSKYHSTEIIYSSIVSVLAPIVNIC